MFGDYYAELCDSDRREKMTVWMTCVTSLVTSSNRARAEIGLEMGRRGFRCAETAHFVAKLMESGDRNGPLKPPQTDESP
ncbi:MAG: hypothetical protein ACE361_03295 [Aureliella sp.]